MPFYTMIYSQNVNKYTFEVKNTLIKKVMFVA